MRGALDSLIKPVKRELKTIPLIEYLPLKLYITLSEKLNALSINAHKWVLVMMYIILTSLN